METVLDKYLEARCKLWRLVVGLSVRWVLEELKPINRGIWVLPADKMAEFEELHAQMVDCYRQYSKNKKAEKTQRWPLLIKDVKQITLSAAEAKSSASYLKNSKLAKEEGLVLADSRKLPPGQTIASMRAGLDHLKITSFVENSSYAEKLVVKPAAILKTYPRAKKLVVHRYSGKAYTARLLCAEETKRINVDILVIDNPEVEIFVSPPRRPRPKLGVKDGVVEVGLPGEGWSRGLFVVMK